MIKFTKNLVSIFIKIIEKDDGSNFVKNLGSGLAKTFVFSCFPYVYYVIR